MESEIVLVFGHLHHRGVSYRQGCVPLVVRVVINHHAFHHTGLLVPVINPEDIPFYAVIESAGRDIDLVLGVTDVIPQGEDLVVCYRYKVVGREIGSYENEERTDENGQHHPGEGRSRGFYGDELIVFRHLPKRHN